MSRLVRGIGTGIAMEVVRGERNVAYVTVEGAAIVVRRMEKREFDHLYAMDVPDGTKERSTPRHYARVFLGAEGRSIAPDAAQLMLNELALHDDEQRGEFTVILTAKSGKLIAAFERRGDAAIARTFYDGARIVASPLDLGDWPAPMIETLRAQVAPRLKAKGRKLLEGVFAMAKAAKKPEAEAAPVTKVDKTTKERAPKADGPVAKVRAFVEKNADALRNGSMTKADARAALLKQGIVGGTIGVQLPKWLAAFKIEAKKGGVVRKDRETGAITISQPKVKAPKPAKDEAPAPAKAKGKAAAAPAPAPKGKAKPTPAKGKAKGKGK